MRSHKTTNVDGIGWLTTVQSLLFNLLCNIGHSIFYLSIFYLFWNCIVVYMCDITEINVYDDVRDNYKEQCNRNSND